MKDSLAPYRVKRSRFTFSCPFINCNKTYNKHSKLEEHTRSHLNIRPFTCECCKKKFFRKNHLDAHMRFVHDKNSHMLTHTCPEQSCGSSFKTKQHLQRHSIMHRRPTLFLCDFFECNESFSKEIDWRKHVATVHKFCQPYWCDNINCTCSFETPSKLQEHSIRMHRKTSVFLCGHTECDHVCTSWSNLQNHMRICSEKRSSNEEGSPESSEFERDKMKYSNIKRKNEQKGYLGKVTTMQKSKINNAINLISGTLAD